MKCLRKDAENTQDQSNLREQIDILFRRAYIESKIDMNNLDLVDFALSDRFSSDNWAEVMSNSTQEKNLRKADYNNKNLNQKSSNEYQVEVEEVAVDDFETESRQNQTPELKPSTERSNNYKNFNNRKHDNQDFNGTRSENNNNNNLKYARMKN
jgi:hypothetical protein